LGDIKLLSSRLSITSSFSSVDWILLRCLEKTLVFYDFLQSSFEADDYKHDNNLLLLSQLKN